MTLASDSIVPMAARATSRRADLGASKGASPSGRADTADPPLLSAGIELSAMSTGRSADEMPSTGVGQAQAKAPEESPQIRPALQLVSADDPTRFGSEDTRATEPQSPDQSATAQRDVLGSAAAKALSRREASGSVAQPFRLEMLSELMGRRQKGPNLDQLSLPRFSTDAHPVATAARRTGSYDQTPGQPAPSSEPMSGSALPRAGIGRSADPANVTRQPGTASRYPMPARTETDTASAGDRPTRDQNDRIAQLLMPALPAIAPEAANQGPEPESEFEFEMRVRVAMEKILSQDLLRHGLNTPEVL